MKRKCFSVTTAIPVHHLSGRPKFVLPKSTEVFRI